MKRFTVGPLFTNCYIIGCPETGKALILDPGFETSLEARKVLSEVHRQGLEVLYIVNTHGHPDHVAGNGLVKKETGAPILIHELDAPMLTGEGMEFFRLFGFHVDSPPADRLLRDGDILHVGEVVLTVLHTPGHSRGSICLLGRDAVFVGDTLFAGSIGRFDLPGGSYQELMKSIRERLMTLPDHVKVYPGHGPPTTIGEERRSNPFL